MTPEEIRGQYKPTRFDSQTFLLAEIAAQLAELKLDVDAQLTRLNERLSDFFTVQEAEK